MFAAAKDARIPENVQAFAEESVAKTRDAYAKINAATQDHVKAVEEIVLAAQAGAKTFGEKFLHTATVNAEAAFDAAEAIAKAKTLPEIARLQADSSSSRWPPPARRPRNLRAVEQDQPPDA
ncbi:MAG: phasin family protein [Hyphomicrobium sp.]